MNSKSVLFFCYGHIVFILFKFSTETASRMKFGRCIDVADLNCSRKWFCDRPINLLWLSIVYLYVAIHSISDTLYILLFNCVLLFIFLLPIVFFLLLLGPLHLFFIPHVVLSSSSSFYNWL